MKKISNYIKDYFLSNALKDDSVLMHKSIVIIYLHFLLISICVCAYISLFFGSTLNSEIPIEFGTFLIVFSLWFFKKYSNIVLTSNFLAYSYFIILAKSVPSTGGLHSDNLLWLILTPMICLLFANKKSGFVGLVILLCFTFYTFICEKNNIGTFVIQNSDYFLTSFIFLFISVFSVAIIFEKGQTLIIKMLENQKQILQNQKQELEQKNQEILQQKIQLEKIGQKLQETNYALEHFAATAAHDLREPLRMISMYTGLAQRRMKDIPDARRDEYMSYATDGASRMSKLLDNLLSFSCSGRQTEDLQTVDLNTTLYHVILNLSVVLKDTGATITSAQLPNLTASESDMSQLLQNLIANAIKFRKDNVISEVEIGYIDRKDNHVITIKDNGIGIKKEHQTKVFAIFQRLNGRDKYDGSGIGLATCRKIVESLDGKIWLRSNEGIGTTFYIAIPKSKAIATINEEEFAYA
jgi:signal transduction histidine kinase